MERNSGANKQTADAQTMEIGEAQLHLTSDGSRCTLHETLFCWFARLLVLVPDFQNGNMTLLFIVKTVRRSKIRLFFFAGRESCSPSPTRYIFQTHVIPHGYEKHCDSKRRKTLEVRNTPLDELRTRRSGEIFQILDSSIAERIIRVGA